MKRSALAGVALALLAGVFALGASAARKPAVPGPSIHYGPVLLYVSNVAAKEGTTAAMQLKLQWMMPMDVEVYWKTVPATATAPRDYLHQSGEAVIKQGKLTTDCLISSVNDTMYEPNRTFKVELWSDNPLVKIVGSPASYTIQDDDPVPAVSIHDQPAPAVYEGGSLTWTVELANPSAYTITVPLDYNYPVDTTVILDLFSIDVNHSWWIPKLGGKSDAIPGYTNHTWFKATRTGVFSGQCAELCGVHHAEMIARVRVVSAPAYESWVARQKRLIGEADQLLRAQRRQMLRDGQLLGTSRP